MSKFYYVYIAKTLDLEEKRKRVAELVESFKAFSRYFSAPDLDMEVSNHTSFVVYFHPNVKKFCMATAQAEFLQHDSGITSYQCQDGKQLTELVFVNHYSVEKYTHVYKHELGDIKLIGFNGLWYSANTEKEYWEICSKLMYVNHIIPKEVAYSKYHVITRREDALAEYFKDSAEGILEVFSETAMKWLNASDMTLSAVKECRYFRKTIPTIKCYGKVITAPIKKLDFSKACELFVVDLEIGARSIHESDPIWLDITTHQKYAKSIMDARLKVHELIKANLVFSTEEAAIAASNLIKENWLKECTFK